jgi:hypothetical protein
MVSERAIPAGIEVCNRCASGKSDPATRRAAKDRGSMRKNKPCATLKRAGFRRTRNGVGNLSHTRSYSSQKGFADRARQMPGKPRSRSNVHHFKATKDDPPGRPGPMTARSSLARSVFRGQSDATDEQRRAHEAVCAIHMRSPAKVSTLNVTGKSLSL